MIALPSAVPKRTTRDSRLFSSFAIRRVGVCNRHVLVFISDSQRRSHSIEVKLALDTSSILTDDVAVESRLRRVLRRHRASLVPFLENIVGQRVPEEVGLWHGSGPHLLHPEGSIVGNCLPCTAGKQYSCRLVLVVSVTECHSHLAPAHSNSTVDRPYVSWKDRSLPGIVMTSLAVFS